MTESRSGSAVWRLVGFQVALLLGYAVAVVAEFLLLEAHDAVRARILVSVFCWLGLVFVQLYGFGAPAAGAWRAALRGAGGLASAAQVMALLLIWPMWSLPAWQAAFRPTLAAAVGATSLAVAAVYGYIAVGSLYTPRWLRWLRGVAIGSLGVVAVTAVFAVLPVGGDRIPYVFAAALAVHGAVMIVLLAFNRDRRRDAAAALAAEAASVHLHCPRCDQEQWVSTEADGSACPRCGLVITVLVEQPRCRACGYYLYGYRVTRCPECGTAVVGTEGEARSEAPTSPAS